MLKLIVVWIFAAVLLLYSLFTTWRSNYNTGLLLVWIVTAMVWVYALFQQPIDTFCKDGFGRVLKYLFIAGAVVFAALFLFVAVSGYTDGVKGDEKAIIVLGAGLHGERVSDVLRRRLEAALDAWQSNPEAVVVVTGGKGPQENIPEAAAMAKWMEEHSVPKDKIIMEDKSTSTEENLLFSKQLLAEAGISPEEPIAVVSNAFHCYRAGKYAEKTGFAEVRTVPASISFTTVLPSYMREVLAVLYMWVFKR